MYYGKINDALSQQYRHEMIKGNKQQDNKMKMHNSTDMGSNALSAQRKFIIRYQQSQNFSNPKKSSKARYSFSNDTTPLRGFLLSQTDVYREQKANQDKQAQKNKEKMLLDRPKRRSFKSPSSIETVMDLINQITPHTSREHVSVLEERDYPKIPIQFNDQKANGLPADNMKFRIIYRGYAPKNTYYYMKSLAFNSLQLNPSIKRSQFQLHFESKFESGNLSAVARKNQREFYIFMREDTNTFGLRQWFYYSVSNKKAGKFKFRVYKYSKYYSLYKEGMRPFVRAMGEDENWVQAGENVKYEYDMDTKSHCLQFEYEFLRDGMVVEFATQPPYTYTMLKQYLKQLINKYPGLKVHKAGETLAGLDIPRIDIVNKEFKNSKRKIIVIMARTHPGETASNWSLQRIIERIYELPEIRNYYDFYIVPMVNPDGVFLGNHRTGVLGLDLNRKFSGNELEFYPEVAVIQKIIQNVLKQKDKQIQFLLDLHGHSARRNIFAYGDEHPIGTNQFLLTHILPKILSEQISTFKYDFCVFKGTKGKKNTARVYLSKKYKINAITFEQSYGLIDDGPIGVQNWRNFGEALVNSLKRFYQLMKEGSFAGLQSYLTSEIQYQKQITEKRNKKKLKMLQQLKTESNVKQISEKIEKFKTEAEHVKQEFSFKQKYQLNENMEIQQKSNDGSVDSSQLSSGDQELENDEESLEFLKKQIAKLGCLKQGLKRQRYNVAERNIQIKSNFQPRLHEQRSSMVPRILKFQMRKRQEAASMKQKQERGRRKLNITQKVQKVQRPQRESIELPQLRRQK